MRAYPVKKKLLESNITPAPVCRFDPILGQIGCSQALVQKQTEYDANDEFRRAYFYECARTKFENR